MNVLNFILWFFIGVTNLFVVDEVSKVSYALIWVCLLLNFLTKII